MDVGEGRGGVGVLVGGVLLVPSVPAREEGGSGGGEEAAEVETESRVRLIRSDRGGDATPRRCARRRKGAGAASWRWRRWREEGPRFSPFPSVVGLWRTAPHSTSTFDTPPKPPSLGLRGTDRGQSSSRIAGEAQGEGRGRTGRKKTTRGSVDSSERGREDTALRRLDQ